jgi:hypothetical protein
MASARRRLGYFDQALFAGHVVLDRDPQPFSFLFATVFTLSKMINTKELMAVISTGTSIYRVTFNIVLFSIVLLFSNRVHYRERVHIPCISKIDDL